MSISQVEKDYAANKDEALKQLEEVRQMILNHRAKGQSPDQSVTIDYGYVGDMAHVTAKLREIATDSNH